MRRFTSSIVAAFVAVVLLTASGISGASPPGDIVAQLRQLAPEREATVALTFPQPIPQDRVRSLLRDTPLQPTVIMSQLGAFTSFYTPRRGEAIDVALADLSQQFIHHLETVAQGGPHGEQAFGFQQIHEHLTELADSGALVSALTLRGTAAQLTELLASSDAAGAQTVLAPSGTQLSTMRARRERSSSRAPLAVPYPNDPWKFSPSSGGIGYFQNQFGTSFGYFYSWFNWADTSGFANPNLGYEHDIYVDAAPDTYVAANETEGVATYTNLPYPYIDTTLMDGDSVHPVTYFTIGSFPCTVQAYTNYYVWVPVRVDTPNHQPTVAGIKPQLGSWAGWYPDDDSPNEAAEMAFCAAFYKFGNQFCIFADQTNIDLRFYQDTSPTAALASRFPFDHRSSSGWWYWDKALNDNWKSASCNLNQYFAQYVRSTNPSELALFSRCENSINSNWGAGRGLGMPSDNFSIRWTGNMWFNPGVNRFRFSHDDGMRLYVDGSLCADAWVNGSATGECDARLTAGRHSIRLDYYEATGNAMASLSWYNPTPAPVISFQVAATSSTSIGYYWQNTDTLMLGYNLQYRTATSPMWTTVSVPYANLMSWSIGGFVPGTTYYLRMNSYNSGGTSTFTNELAFTLPDTSPPPAPTSLTVSSPTSGTANLGWQFSGATLGGISIERSVAGTGAYSVVATTGFSSINFSGLTPGARFDFRVRAWNGNGWSPYSNVATITIAGAATWMTVLSEGAETYAPGWYATTWSGSGFYIETSSASYSGYRRIRMSSAPSSYVNNSNSAFTSPAFSLVGKSSCIVTLAFKTDTEPNYDTFWIEASPDNGSSWIRFSPVWSGTYPSGTAWATASLQLGGAVLGQPNVRIRLRFTSNASNARWGVAVDDILVRAQ